MVTPNQISKKEKALDHAWRVIAVCDYCGYRVGIKLDKPVGVENLEVGIEGLRCLNCNRYLA